MLINISNTIKNLFRKTKIYLVTYCYYCHIKLQRYYQIINIKSKNNDIIYFPVHNMIYIYIYIYIYTSKYFVDIKKYVTGTILFSLPWINTEIPFRVSTVSKLKFTESKSVSMLYSNIVCETTKINVTQFSGSSHFVHIKPVCLTYLFCDICLDIIQLCIFLGIKCSMIEEMKMKMAISIY